MKFSLHVNQKQALELGIKNMSQAVIFDLLTGVATWAAPEIIDNEVFYWVSRQRICTELPLLDLKPDTVYRYIKALAEIGVLEYKKVGKKDCIRIAEKGQIYYVGKFSENDDFTMSENNPKNGFPYVGKKSEINSENNPTYKTTKKQISTSDLPVKKTSVKKFIKPSVEDVRLYCQQRNNAVDAERFHSYYESNGWKVGKNPMKNWQAAIRTWERGGNHNAANSQHYHSVGNRASRAHQRNKQKYQEAVARELGETNLQSSAGEVRLQVVIPRRGR